MRVDFLKCDLLLVIGTSLSVQPFNTLVHRVPRDTPRVLVNLASAGEASALPAALGIDDGLQFRHERNYRDLFVQGDCQRSTLMLARCLGFDDDIARWLDDSTPGIRREFLADVETPLNATGSIIHVGAPGDAAAMLAATATKAAASARSDDDSADNE
jgi:hypothetical protein